jgi:hypothetical protein
MEAGNSPGDINVGSVQREARNASDGETLLSAVLHAIIMCLDLLCRLVSFVDGGRTLDAAW